MAKLSQMDDLPYRGLFNLAFVATFITSSLAATAVTQQTVLPLVYPSDEPVMVTNNDGSLSNGDTLRGWRLGVFLGSYGALLMALMGVALYALVRAWPAKHNAPPASPGRIDST